MRGIHDDKPPFHSTFGTIGNTYRSRSPFGNNKHLGRESLEYNMQFLAEEHQHPFHPKINNNSKSMVKVDNRLPLYKRTP